jgi:hypothetical protein
MIHWARLEVVLMPVSEARKRSNAKWDAENMKVISCKARIEIIETFKALCLKNDDTPNAILTEAMKAYIEAHTKDRE